MRDQPATAPHGDQDRVTTTAALEALRDDLARWDADDLTDLERLRIELWQEKGV